MNSANIELFSNKIQTASQLLTNNNRLIAVEYFQSAMRRNIH